MQQKHFRTIHSATVNLFVQHFPSALSSGFSVRNPLSQLGRNPQNISSIICTAYNRPWEVVMEFLHLNTIISHGRERRRVKQKVINELVVIQTPPLWGCIFYMLVHAVVYNTFVLILCTQRSESAHYLSILTINIINIITIILLL